MEQRPETRAFLRFLRRKVEESRRAGHPPRPTFPPRGPFEPPLEPAPPEAEAARDEVQCREMERLLARLFQADPPG